MASRPSRPQSSCSCSTSCPFNTSPRQNVSPRPSTASPPMFAHGNSTLALSGHSSSRKRHFTEDPIYAGRSAEFVYHYTDLNGMQGIVSANDLWLTHSRFSNDEEEMTLGQRRAREAVIAARQRPTRSTEWARYLERVEALLQQPAGQGVYISCFCRQDNLLSQWRTYGANGVGVSLKLNPAKFSFATGPDSPIGGLMRLWGVVYDRDKQRYLVNEVLRFMFNYKRARRVAPIPGACTAGGGLHRVLHPDVQEQRLQRRARVPADLHSASDPVRPSPLPLRSRNAGSVLQPPGSDGHCPRLGREVTHRRCADRAVCPPGTQSEQCAHAPASCRLCRRGR